MRERVTWLVNKINLNTYLSAELDFVDMKSSFTWSSFCVTMQLGIFMDKNPLCLKNYCCKTMYLNVTICKWP